MIELASHHPSDDTENSLLEPLTPELALVDPELARRARDRLPPPGETHASHGRALQSDRDVIETSAARGFASKPRSGSEQSRKQEPRAGGRRRRVRVLLGALGVVLAATAVYVLLPDSTVREEAGNRAPKKASTQGLQGTQRKSAKQPNGSSTSTVPRRSGVLGATAQVKARAPRRKPFPIRVFIWPAAPDATFYKVEFFRSGREVFETSSSATRFELPMRWVYRGRRYQIENGTYIWKVLPAHGPRSRPRYGKPIVRSTWVAQL